jgi:hypothetical protein
MISWAYEVQYYKCHAASWEYRIQAIASLVCKLSNLTKEIANIGRDSHTIATFCISFIYKIYNAQSSQDTRRERLSATHML